MGREAASRSQSFRHFDSSNPLVSTDTTLQYEGQPHISPRSEHSSVPESFGFTRKSTLRVAVPGFF